MKYIIDIDDHDVRLDRYLKKKLKDTPMGEIFKAMKVGKIKVNNKKKQENYRLQEGDKIFIGIGNLENQEEEKFIELSEEDKKYLESHIFFETEDAIIYYKEKDIVMHKGSGHDYGLSEMFKSYYNTNDFNFINRIDKKTSGLVIGAKTKRTTRELSEEMRNNLIEKRYYILVHGNIKKKEFVIENYLKKIEDKVIVTTEDDEDGKIAITYYKVIGKNDKYTLLEGRLETGRTHQLRVQLSNIGHPIVGDTRYGIKDREDTLYLNSFYCHLKVYGVEVEEELPDYFKEKCDVF